MSAPRKSLYILPSLFTVASIFCGFLAIVLAVQAQTAEGLHRAALLIVIAAFFDGFDGRVARMTNTQSEFGVQLDSLADVLSFGMAPAVIAYQFALQDLGFIGVFAAFVFVACGAIRLARFNVQAATDGGASTHFIGLPIPGGAGVVTAALLVMTSMGYYRVPAGFGWLAAVLMAGVGALMVSNVRYKTFKKIRVTTHEKVIVGVCIAFFAFASVRWDASLGLAAIMVTYVSMGLLGALLSTGRRGLRGLRAVRTAGMVDE